MESFNSVDEYKLFVSEHLSFCASSLNKMEDTDQAINKDIESVLPFGTSIDQAYFYWHLKLFGVVGLCEGIARLCKKIVQESSKSTTSHRRTPRDAEDMDGDFETTLDEPSNITQDGSYEPSNRLHSEHSYSTDMNSSQLRNSSPQSSFPRGLDLSDDVNQKTTIASRTGVIAHPKSPTSRIRDEGNILTHQNIAHQGGFNSETPRSQDSDIDMVPDSRPLVEDTHNQPIGCGYCQIILDDWREPSESRMLFYLASLPEEVLKMLILGCLPNMMRDDDFNDRNGEFVRLRQSQGTYVCYLAAAKDHIYDDGSETLAGLGLTFDDMTNLVKIVQRYIDIEDPQSEDLARKIDGMCDKTESALTYATYRRWIRASGPNRFAVHRKWINHWDSVLTETRQKFSSIDDIGNKQLFRCLSYAGLSCEPLARGPSHWSLHATDSPLFGLIKSAVKYLFGDKYTLQGFTYQVFRTVDERDIGLDEIVTGFITFGRPEQGGVNYADPGKHLGREQRPKDYERRLTENIASIDLSRVQHATIAKSSQKIQEVQHWWKKREEVDRQWETMKLTLQQNLQMAKKMEEGLPEVEKALEDYERIRGVLDGYDRELAQASRS